MHRHLGKIAKVFIFFAVGMIMLYLVYQRQNVAFQADCAIKGTPASECSLMAKVVQDISGANYFWVLATMVLFMISNVIRALRWRMMFQAMGYQPKFINLLGTIMINYLANLGIPRSGEVIRAGLIAEYEDIPVEKALGTIVTDRIFDVLMLLIMIGLAMIFGGNDFLAYLDQHANLGQKLSALVASPARLVTAVAAVFGIAYTIYHYRSRLRNSAIGQKIYGMVAGFSDGVGSVKNVSSIPLFIIYTILIWVLYYFMMYFAFFTFAPTAHLGPLTGLVIFVFGSLGLVIPTPGGMGSYHFLVGEGLAMYGINGSDAFSFANIVFFSIQIFINIFFGIVALVCLPIINKK